MVYFNENLVYFSMTKLSITIQQGMIWKLRVQYFFFLGGSKVRVLFGVFRISLEIS